MKTTWLGLHPASACSQLQANQNKLNTANHEQTNPKRTKVKTLTLRTRVISRNYPSKMWVVCHVRGRQILATLELIDVRSLPRRAWNSWLPKMADTLPTLFLKVCSSGLVRLAWYCLRSPTARSVSVYKTDSRQTWKHAQLLYRIPEVMSSTYQIKQTKQVRPDDQRPHTSANMVAHSLNYYWQKLIV